MLAILIFTWFLFKNNDLMIFDRFIFALPHCEYNNLSKGTVLIKG